MGKKRDDGTFDDACLEKVQPGEPIFVLRAQDEHAPYAIKAWANRVESEWQDTIGWHGPTPPELPANVQQKLDEARETAALMEAWPTRKLPD